MSRKSEFTCQSSTAPIGMTWACLVPCACVLCQPLWRIHVSSSGRCPFETDGSCTSAKCQITVNCWETQNYTCSQLMACRKCWCLWMACRSHVQNFKSSPQGMQFTMSSPECTTWPQNFSYGAQFKCIVFQGRYENYDYTCPIETHIAKFLFHISS